jgi:hypothetical protein
MALPGVIMGEKRAQCGYGGNYHRKVSLLCMNRGENQYIVYVQKIYYSTRVYNICKNKYNPEFKS